MNVQKFQARSSHEALHMARKALGDAALILSNRAVAGGVEVLATSEEGLQQMQSRPLPRLPSAPGSGSMSSGSDSIHRHPDVQRDTEELAMSTLSFQEYVRERMLRKRQNALREIPAHAPSGNWEQSPAWAPVALHTGGSSQYQPQRAMLTEPPTGQTPRPHGTSESSHEALMRCMSDLKSSLQDQFSQMSWLDSTRKHPIHSRLLLKLLRAGYSPALSQQVLDAIADNSEPQAAIRKMIETLSGKIRSDHGGPSLVEEGGIFALVGPAGSGKTTTAVKLAAQCAQLHGSASVGLITLDNYRLGAYDQLRSFAQIMGIVPHMARDRTTLMDLLQLLSSRRLVLIDTASASSHESRQHELAHALDLPRCKKVLVMDAGLHGDTQDSIVKTHRIQPGDALALTRLDLTAKLGPALDTAMRHRLVLRGTSSGQRVPEDWHRPNPEQLVRDSMKSSGPHVHDPHPDTLGMAFLQTVAHSSPSESPYA